MAEVVCAPLLNAFKARLDEHWAQVRYTTPDQDWVKHEVKSSMWTGTTGLIA